MTSSAIRFAPFAVLAAGVLLISGIREQYVVPPKQPINAMQTNLVGMVGRDTIVSEDERRVAGMSSYVMRQYDRDSSTLFSVYVGYYDRQIQGKTIHSPKNCLPGAGWDVLDTKRISLDAVNAGGTINRVMLANKGARVLVYYWYQGRGRIEANEYKVKWDLLRDAALYGRTEEALVRIVVPVNGPQATPSVREANEVVADSIARKVVNELAPAVQLLLPDAPGR